MEQTGGPEGYVTVAEGARAEFTEKRSRFIASVSPAADMAGAERFWAGVKAEFRDARHNAFAARLGGEGQSAERFSDDGEPQGTAGLPALELLRRRGVTNACVVVTRYFGGILLGAPGLLRAYGRAAALALARAELVTMRRCVLLRFSCPYALLAQAEGLAHAAGRVESREFGAQAVLRVAVPAPGAPGFRAALTELSGGAVRAEEEGGAFLPASGLPGA